MAAKSGKSCKYGRDQRFKSKVRCRKSPPKRRRGRSSPAQAMSLEGVRRRRRRRRARR